MFRCLLLLASLSSAATLTITPALISDCTYGLGTATLTWSGASGPVQIHVNQPSGVALTGFDDPSGTAVTGAWVTDGMKFYLVDQAGTTEASATAGVNCGGTPRTIDQGLAGGSYFPLAVGNTWVYKTNDRILTAAYEVWSITGTQIIGTETYFVVTLTALNPPVTLMLLRADSNGVIWKNTPSGDQVYLDPTSAPQTTYSGPLGTFSNAIAPPAQLAGGLERTSLIFVRGLGLANSQSTLETGSSGGFSGSLDLVDVRVDGVHLSVPAPKIALGIETTDLDLTNKLAPNCALPCYFVACGLGGFVDPPGTYRPCAQARIEASSPASNYTVLLELLDPGGKVLSQASTQPITPTSLDYVRLPLYIGGAQFTLLAPGNYTLSGSIVANGATQATSTITVQVH
jgi:hypothetical protein